MTRTPLAILDLSQMRSGSRWARSDAGFGQEFHFVGSIAFIVAPLPMELTAHFLRLLNVLREHSCLAMRPFDPDQDARRQSHSQE